MWIYFLSHWSLRYKKLMKMDYVTEPHTVNALLNVWGGFCVGCLLLCDQQMVILTQHTSHDNQIKITIKKADKSQTLVWEKTSSKSCWHAKKIVLYLNIGSGKRKNEKTFFFLCCIKCEKNFLFPQSKWKVINSDILVFLLLFWFSFPILIFYENWSVFSKELRKGKIKSFPKEHFLAFSLLASPFGTRSFWRKVVGFEKFKDLKSIQKVCE